MRVGAQVSRFGGGRLRELAVIKPRFGYGIDPSDEKSLWNDVVISAISLLRYHRYHKIFARPLRPGEVYDGSELAVQLDSEFAAPHPTAMRWADTSSTSTRSRRRREAQSMRRAMGPIESVFGGSFRRRG
jgi:hypothetical protein